MPGSVWRSASDAEFRSTTACSRMTAPGGRGPPAGARCGVKPSSGGAGGDGDEIGLPAPGELVLPAAGATDLDLAKNTYAPATNTTIVSVRNQRDPDMAASYLRRRNPIGHRSPVMRPNVTRPAAQPRKNP